MASTAARAALPAISATDSSNWSSESKDDRVSSGCCDVVGLLTTVCVEVAACFSSREIRMFRPPWLGNPFSTQRRRRLAVSFAFVLELFLFAAFLEFSRGTGGIPDR